MRALIAFLLFAAASLAAAQAYRWIDKDGKVRYGDVPPVGVKATPVKGPSTGAGPAEPAGSAAGKAPLTPEQAFNKRREEERKKDEADTKARSEAADAKSNCESAKGSLTQLESGARVSRTNEQGERIFLEDAQRAQEIERARKVVSQWCK